MVIKTTSQEEWIRMVQDDPYATFFHTPCWYTLWSKYLKANVKPLLLCFNTGQRAILPLLEKRSHKGLVKNFKSSPVGTYGGLIADEQLTQESQREYLNFISSVHGKITFNPYRPENLQPKGRVAFTQAINLKVGAEDNFKSWSKGHKSASKRALREGVELAVAKTEKDWDDYYHIYEKSLERWGDTATSRYSRNLFEGIQEFDPQKRTLWLAKFDGKVISGCLCFYHNNHVSYWHGAGDSDYFKLGAVHFLQREIIKDACKRGYMWYDFNPSGGHEGVEKFKRGFSTEKINFVRLNTTTVSSKIKALRGF